MAHRPEKESGNEPEFRYFEGSRPVRIAKSAGVVAVCLFLGGGYTLLQGNGEPIIRSEVVSPDGQPSRAHDLEGKDITLEAGTAIEVLCYNASSHRFIVDAGEYEGVVAEGLPRDHINALQDPFYADQAPGGPQDRLAPLLDC
jgi:hypothetical protein